MINVDWSCNSLQIKLHDKISHHLFTIFLCNRWTPITDQHSRRVASMATDWIDCFMKFPITICDGLLWLFPGASSHDLFVQRRLPVAVAPFVVGVHAASCARTPSSRPWNPRLSQCKGRRSLEQRKMPGRFALQALVCWCAHRQWSNKRHRLRTRIA